MGRGRLSSGELLHAQQVGAVVVQQSGASRGASPELGTDSGRASEWVTERMNGLKERLELSRRVYSLIVEGGSFAFKRLLLGRRSTRLGAKMSYTTPECDNNYRGGDCGSDTGSAVAWNRVKWHRDTAVGAGRQSTHTTDCLPACQ
eukprot:GHVU01143010.1.p1 GENE.GHVU01143010.1~~GHVU01143010.1.p1  ORF type:complete len:146 (+),score=15.86 GHVU01143010.1:560-997(+)